MTVSRVNNFSTNSHEVNWLKTTLKIKHDCFIFKQFFEDNQRSEKTSYHIPT
jgi:hypothetical protein